MASTIVAPVPHPHAPNRQSRKDAASLPLQEGGRTTPLPQYEKTQSVPFNLTLQEDKSNPGQFQLVVDINPEKTKRSDGGSLKPAASKRLYTNLQAFPGLGYDVSSLYQTQRSSPPTSPQHETGWSDLDAIPPDFLQKVVPDWEVTFQRKDSTASTQSRRLADIKARIKKSGRGFVVRLLKGSNPESNEVAEIQLGQQSVAGAPAAQELDSCPQAELDATESAIISPMQPTGPSLEGPEVFEIGTSSEPGIRPTAPRSPSTHSASIPQWLSQTANSAPSRSSILEEGFSDAETLAHEVQSTRDRLEDDATDLEPSSNITTSLPTRTTSIVKTPTRGLSVVGPVKRINRADRARATAVKGKAARLNLNRSDATKSFRRRASHNSTAAYATGSALSHSVPSLNSLVHPSDRISDEEDSAPQPVSKRHIGKDQPFRRSSAEDIPQSSNQKTKLKLQTNVPRPKSTNTSLVTTRRRSPHIHKSSPSFPSAAEERRRVPSPAWSEVDYSDELRDAQLQEARAAIERAFSAVETDAEDQSSPAPQSIPRIEEPTNHDHVGEIYVPPDFEVPLSPANTRNPTLTFWGLALNALSEKLSDGFHALRTRYGPEPPVPPNHARVRWTCSCGERLYDDFIEKYPGAARGLEQFLNRPRAVVHTPTSPIGRASRESTLPSVFSSVSTASTLTTPASTYSGASSWGRDASKYNPMALRSHNPSSVQIPGFPEQWLLTCANEGRFTPKIVHLDVNEGRIRDDKDLALALREHYERLNGRWLNWARLRGLTTIEFVQFEVHRNRFADIRASPSMPPSSSLGSTKSPSEQPYTFAPVDLMPPVGSTYLLHLFKHPSDYDGEMITYLRSPKRRERLPSGMGWGINLVEGFQAQKVWMFVMLGFGLGSGVFGIVWTFKKGDVQGAFGVAGWIVTLATLVLGGLQAWLE